MSPLPSCPVSRLLPAPSLRRASTMPPLPSPSPSKRPLPAPLPQPPPPLLSRRLLPLLSLRSLSRPPKSRSSSLPGGPCSAGSPCVGQVTFYDTATSMSAPSSCGLVNDGSSENVIALPVGIMQDSDCGRTVVIKYNGKTSKGTVVDKCMGCDNTSIDLSRHFFSLLASFDAGRLHGVEWYLE
ncbi:hypothetical protein BJX65DRAFT_251778 [Aspergillus insuetus]